MRLHRILSWTLLHALFAVSAACSDNNGSTGVDDTDSSSDVGTDTASVPDSTDDTGNDDTASDAEPEDTEPVDRTRIFEIAATLGKGVNLGNWLEAPNQDWGVICTQEDVDRIAAAGFDTIRVPARWESRTATTAPFAIDPGFFALVDDLIDWALTADLNIVIDMHHHDDMFEDAPGQKERFLAMWQQISERYAGEPETLMFEIMNEPHDTLTADLWNEYLIDALSVIRQTNPTRPVVIGTAEWGGIGAMNRLALPNDADIIFTFHYYSPFEFTHQGAEWSEGSNAWIGTTWTGTYFQKLAIANDVFAVEDWARENNVPVWVGEFGAYSVADMDSRALWTEACARFFEDAGFTWSYWEYKAGFGVWDPDAQSWNEPLVEALFSTDTSILALDPSALGDSILVNGDFSTDDADWTFGDWGGDATATVEDGEMVVRLTDPGAVPWDIQLKQMLPPLTEGTEYTLVFDVRADAPRGLAVAIQNQVAWDVHASGTFSAASQFRTQVLNFTMGIDDDQVALVFNCGAETAALYIDNVYLVVSP